MMKLNIQDSKFQIQDPIKKSSIWNLQSLMRDSKGMTLLEIAISMAILSIALVALATLFPLGLKSSRRASNFSGASILAQRVIENIKRAASVYDNRDNADFLVGDISYGDGIGYFELANNQDVLAFPFNDDDLAEKSAIEQDANNYRIYFFRYYEDETHTTVMDMTAHVKSVDYDLDNSGTAGDNDERKLIQKVYVAVYWKEADKDRADTFIVYISNPFYEKYK